MEVWGITGLIGAGKSTALRHLAERGYPIVDADRAARAAVDPSTPTGRAAVREVAEVFGESVLDAAGTGIDRAALRARLARSGTGSGERDRLERILHPRIRALLLATIQSWPSSARLGFVEGSRIVESGLTQSLAGCILVTAPAELRLARVQARDGVSEESVRGIMRLQDEARLRGGCGILWENAGDERALQALVDTFVASRLGGSNFP
jgi:dephospho-CoA kinase